MAEQLFQAVKLDLALTSLLRDRIDIERRWLAWVSSELSAVALGARSDIVLRANRELVDGVFNLLDKSKLDDALAWLEVFAASAPPDREAASGPAAPENKR